MPIFESTFSRPLLIAAIAISLASASGPFRPTVGSSSIVIVSSIR